ncbi:hypothetical protein [Rhodococcus rhodnii]|uniref:hypothetical protein n=1 Tax=Rhodococcus rhodnii TaxID=38312 RepID=UPI0009F92EF0|nr:hypothetical protein [Rhodococcus rhodnii]
MFEQWPEGLEPQCRRIVDPPMRVRVRLAAAIARDAPAKANEIALRVRAEGLVLDEIVDGELLGWCRSNRGDWLGVVDIELHTSNRLGRLPLRQLIPAGAIERADER